jgi:hypothetical protein
VHMTNRWCRAIGLSENYVIYKRSCICNSIRYDVPYGPLISSL